MVKREGGSIVMEMRDWEELVRMLSRTKNILESAANNLALSVMLIGEVFKGESDPDRLQDAIEGIQIVGDALVAQAEDVVETVRNIGLSEVK